jgi:hypothetical protein
MYKKWIEEVRNLFLVGEVQSTFEGDPEQGQEKQSRRR